MNSSVEVPVMKMNWIFAAILAVNIVQGQNITYSVIADHPQSKFTLVVDNTTYPLTVSGDVSILYTGMAPVASKGYHYAQVSDNGTIISEELFERRPVVSSQTQNEFYNRNWNTKNLTIIEQVFAPIEAIHRINTSLHRSGEIPTIYIQGDIDQIKAMHNDTLADIKCLVNMTYIGLDDIQIFRHVRMSLSGRFSRRMKKLSYNLKLDKDDLLYGFRRIKLRSLATDPSYVREQLAVDYVKSVGVPTTDFSYARVMLNDEPIGLYGIIEHFKNPWLQNEFGNGDTLYKQGTLYLGAYATQESALHNNTADLSYRGKSQKDYNDGTYIIKQCPSNGKCDLERLVNLIQFINEAPTSGTNASSAWEAELDMDSVLRGLAMEVLLGYADGYMTMANNYGLFDDLEMKKIVYIPTDFDFTFGSTIVHLDRMWSGNYSDFPGLLTRPMSSKATQVPEFKDRFEQVLSDVIGKVFNVNVSSQRIDDLYDFLRDDVLWDKTQCVKYGTDMSGDTRETTGEVASSYLDRNLVLDIFDRMNSGNISMETAIYGTINRTSLTGVKEWIQRQSEGLARSLNIQL